jgi:hypothetical protein
MFTSDRHARCRLRAARLRPHGWRTTAAGYKLGRMALLGNPTPPPPHAPHPPALGPRPQLGEHMQAVEHAAMMQAATPQPPQQASTHPRCRRPREGGGEAGAHVSGGVALRAARATPATPGHIGRARNEQAKVQAEIERLTDYEGFERFAPSKWDGRD